MLENDIVDTVTDDTPTDEVEEAEASQAEDDIEVSGEGESHEEEEIEAEASEDDSDDAEEAVAPTVKVEYDGKEYDVPTEIKDALMRNKDYTQKTQSLADQRREFDESQTQFKQYQEASQVHADKMAELKAIDLQLQQYQQIDWNAAMEQDFEQATKLNMQAQQLQATRNNLVNEIDGAEQQRQKLLGEQMARTAEKTDQAMTDKYSNWGEVKAELGQFAVESLGFPAEAVQRAVSEPEMNALYLAQIGFKTLQKAQEAAKAPKPEKVVKPSKTIKPKRNKAPTDLSKVKDPVAYREMRMRQRVSKLKG